MRIGEFWGMSAPMLCILLQRSEDVQKLYESAPAYLGAESFDSIRKELSWLYHSVLSLCEYTARPGAEDFFVTDASATNHQVPEEELDSWKRAFMVKAALQLIAGEQKGLSYSLASTDVDSVRNELKEFVDCWFRENEFSTMDTQSQVRKFAKSLQTETLSAEKSQILATAFALSFTVVDSVSVNGSIHRLSDAEKKVVSYFANRLDFISEIYHKFAWFRHDDVRVFGVSAIELLKRKPSALRYAVANHFQYLQAMSSRIALENTISYTRHEIARYKAFIQRSVESDDVAFNELLTPVMLDDLLFRESSDCRSYFKTLFDNKILNYSDYLREDALLLIGTYNAIRGMSVDDLIRELGLPSDVDLQSLIDNLNSIGIVGFNLDTLWLFTDAMRNTPVMSSVRLRQSPEKITEIKTAIADIEAFLDTLIPIGEVLQNG